MITMNRLYPLLLLLISLGFYSCNSDPTSNVTPRENPNHHALLLMSQYIPIEKTNNLVIPYEVNIMALDLLQKGNGQYTTLCRDYIRWYLDHVNPFDKYDLSGSIYDYQVDYDGKERSSAHYDSIDATSASFILLLHRFYKKSGYKSIIEQNRKKIEDIIYMIPHLQDEKDGLIRTMPIGNQKLLVNNCLSLAAIDAFLDLSREFHWGKEIFYQDARESLYSAIIQHLYRPSRHEFFYKIDETGAYAPDWTIFYPDRYSQLFPLLFHIHPDRQQDQVTWTNFQRYHQEYPPVPAPGDPCHLIVLEWVNKKMKISENQKLPAPGGLH